MKILLVDDDPDMLAVTSFALRQAGMLVVEASSFDRALSVFRAEQPDLAILDINIPGGSGFELCQALRRESKLPILMLTVRNEEADLVRALELSADDYLGKPYSPRTLIARVKALLRRGPVNRSSTLRVADLELDRLTQQVKRAGRRIELTAKEFALLEYLMRHPGRVLTRTQIVDSVWRYDLEALSNVVDIYIHYLRDKIDQGFSRPLIKTVRGVGYKIEA